MERKLAAILAADVVGYSRLMQEDEAGTLAALKQRRKEILEPTVARHRGRIIKVMGDGVLVEFASAVAAVQCAVELQQAMSAANDANDANNQSRKTIVLRIGVNLGDLVVEGSDLYGDGVNVAARLEAIAEPGTICISAKVRDEVHGKVDAKLEDMGEVALKNMERPVRVYRVNVGPAIHDVKKEQGQGTGAKPSIAVLPFTNMSGDPAQEYFSDGITEDLITELSRFRSLFVIARHSSFQYRGQNIDLKRVGRELGVQYVIEGSIRVLGNRMRVTAQLIEAGTGNHIWAERYDRDLSDIFSLQDDLVHAVAATVSGRVDAAGRERTIRLSPAGLEAYDLHLRAKALYLKFTKEDNAEARLLAQRALTLDPNNALVHAYYGLYCDTDYSYGWVADVDELLRTALEFSKKAVALDGADSCPRWILSFVYLSACNFAEARLHIEKALELNPNDTEARGMYGLFLSCAGELDNALIQFEIVKRHNPFDFAWLPWVRGQVYFNAHQYGQAIDNFNEANEASNEVNAWLAASYAHDGQLKEAKNRLNHFLRIAEREMVHFPGQQRGEWEKFLRRAFPYRDSRDFEHLREGLRKAGLPV